MLFFLVRHSLCMWPTDHSVHLSMCVVSLYFYLKISSILYSWYGCCTVHGARHCGSYGIICLSNTVAGIRICTMRCGMLRNATINHNFTLDFTVKIISIDLRKIYLLALSTIWTCSIALAMIPTPQLRNWFIIEIKFSPFMSCVVFFGVFPLWIRLNFIQCAVSVVIMCVLHCAITHLLNLELKYLLLGIHYI